MIRDLSRRIALVGSLFAVSASVALAQGFGGGFPSPEESFRRLDRNGNDQIDPEEWESLPPPFRRAFEDRADLSRPVDFEQYVEISRALREEMMRRFSPGGDRERSPRDRGPRDERPSGGADDGGRGSTRPGGGSSRGSPDRASSADSRTDKKESKPRAPLNLKLPEKFRDRDRDRDGQIGLYEWPRSDYAGFRRLDLNGDGFLTPAELARSPNASPPSGAPVATSAPDTASSGSSGTSVAMSSAPAGSTPAAGESGPRNPAETAFKLLDRNKDGSVSEEEWKKSLSTAPAFEKAGISVNFPLSRNEFFRLYPQAYPNSAGK